MPYAGPSDASTATATATATRPSYHRRTRSSSNFSDERGPGAFAGLGQLPRLTKKAVFHINDNDDDNADDNDRPSYPSYQSPYSPLNSLRLSMNTGRFSPSVEPPPRIDIPPASVPFPTSSPSSPPHGLSPFFLPSMSRSSSRTASPSLPRTPSTPIILSNGKPLKSSLKSSASSPNISDLPIKHIRAQSAPATPNNAKNVHFAEKDSGLETIRVFNRTGKPASLSKPPGEETETETEAESSSFPFPVLPSSPITSAGSAALVHEIDTSIERTNPVPKLSPSPYDNVFLETLALPRTRPPTMRGTILVRNMSFEKTVAVRFTLDDWQTTSEVMGKHVVSLPGLPPPFPRTRTLGDVAGQIASGQQAEDEQRDSAGPAWDRFSFTIRLEDYEAKLADRTLFLVVRYNPGSGGEYWDNNDNANYRVGFRRAAASPLPSPAIGVAPSQQRTFSAPSTLRTTPITGAVVSPYTPPTRQLVPPQLTRSVSTPFPPVSPSAVEQKDREKMSEKGLGSPTAVYLSRKLSLSNYVAPSAHASSSSMVTPPTTPPGSVRVRSSSLPTDAGLNADESKEPSNQGDDKPSEEKKDANATRPALTQRPTPVQSRPTIAIEPAPAPGASQSASQSRTRPPSPPRGSTTPMLSPLSSIPGPSVSALATQARSFGPTSYGFGFDGGSTLGYARPQLLSPPRSKESSPASSGNTSPRRTGSPERKQPALGLEIPSPSTATASKEGEKSDSSEDSDEDEDDEDTDTPASVSSLTTAVRELGLGVAPHAAANANARVDTSDPSYAALLRQWCFAQSSPPAPTPAPAVAKTGGGSPVRSGETTPRVPVGFGHSAGYGFPGFSFGVPDVPMVGAHMR